jgi:hypothetical protein
VIGIPLKPAAQLAELGAIAGRVHVALIKDVAEQDPVAQLCDQSVGVGPFRAPLQREDLPIQLDVAAAEMRRR